MQYGIHVNSGASVTDPAVLRDMAQLAEELGCESILIGDHVLPPQKIQTPFPVKMDNPPWHVYQEQDWPDCFTTLAFLAAITTRVRLGVSVIILPYRHPAAVTKMITTLDRLSNGRIICGVGIGWLKDEFGFLGVPFEDRAALSEDCLKLMKTLWTDPHPRLSTAYGSIDADVNFGPQPVQQPHPPIWIGGNTLPALRRVARWGDGWQPVFLSPETIQQKTETLHALMQEAGRDATQLEITTLVGSNVSVTQAQTYQAAGVQTLYMLTTTDRPDELFAQMKQFVATMREVGNG